MTNMISLENIKEHSDSTYLTQLDEKIRLESFFSEHSTNKVSIYPYGREGHIVADILREVYHLEPCRIFDNFAKGALPIKDLEQHPLEQDEFLIFAVLTRKNYEELRDNLPKGNVWNLYPYRDEKEMPKDCIWQIFEREVKFYLPLFQEDAIQGIIYDTNNYASSNDLTCLQSLIPEDVFTNSIVLDIGANIGNHTLYFVKECGASKVYSFEPVPQTYEILHKNIEINGLEGIVTTVNRGVGARRSQARIQSFSREDLGKSIISYDDVGELKIVALDDMSFDGRVGFVKIDVEGFEVEVFLGAKEFLGKNRPIIFCEIWPNLFDDHFPIISEI